MLTVYNKKKFWLKIRLLLLLLLVQMYGRISVPNRLARENRAEAVCFAGDNFRQLRQWQLEAVWWWCCCRNWQLLLNKRHISFFFLFYQSKMRSFSLCVSFSVNQPCRSHKETDRERFLEGKLICSCLIVAAAVLDAQSPLSPAMSALDANESPLHPLFPFSQNTHILSCLTLDNCLW